MFRDALTWLAQNHPKVLTENAKHIPTYGMFLPSCSQLIIGVGSWKDILYLVTLPAHEKQALELFATQLRADLAAIDNSKDKHASISLCGKWAPTEHHSDDKKSNVAKKLATFMFSDSKIPKAEYRKKVLTPLRTHLRIAEQLMCANQWDKIEYSNVPSRCMNLSRKAFKAHDGTRFDQFLGDVKEGKKTIKGKQMFPHELASHYISRGEYDEVIELQWKSIIEGVQKEGTLTDSIVLSDVSSSMSGTPMQVSIALGLLISEVTAPPFTNAVITFAEKPSFHMVRGNNLMERVQNLAAAPWGGSTNFAAAFDLILERAIRHNLSAENMPKRLFVISDMQFDIADNGFTNFQSIDNKYKNAGYPFHFKCTNLYSSRRAVANCKSRPPQKPPSRPIWSRCESCPRATSKFKKHQRRLLYRCTGRRTIINLHECLRSTWRNARLMCLLHIDYHSISV